jgi:hypothetical protein
MPTLGEKIDELALAFDEMLRWQDRFFAAKGIPIDPKDDAERERIAKRIRAAKSALERTHDEPPA